jgi:hypothetical protein
MSAASDRTIADRHDTASRRVVHNAADWRKRLRREIHRVRAGTVSLYIDGPRGVVHVRLPGQPERVCVRIDEALRALRSLPDGAGLHATSEALAMVHESDEQACRRSAPCM